MDDRHLIRKIGDLIRMIGDLIRALIRSIVILIRMIDNLIRSIIYLIWMIGTWSEPINGGTAGWGYVMHSLTIEPVVGFGLGIYQTGGILGCQIH